LKKPIRKLLNVIAINDFSNKKMDIRQQCLYCSKLYSYSGTFINYVGADYTLMIVYVSGEQLSDDGTVGEHNSDLLSFVHALLRNPFVHPSDGDSSNSVADSQNVSTNPEHPHILLQIYGTPPLTNHYAGKPNCNEYFDIFQDAIDRWSLLICKV
jgi:hypothetical protein